MPHRCLTAGRIVDTLALGGEDRVFESVMEELRDEDVRVIANDALFQLAALARPMETLDQFLTDHLERREAAGIKIDWRAILTSCCPKSSVAALANRHVNPSTVFELPQPVFGK